MILNAGFPNIMRIGAGARHELASVLSELGVRRPMLVTDRFMVQSGRAEELLEGLRGKTAFDRPPVFSETVPDPTSDSVEAGLEVLNASGADCIVALGGGSPMDTGKAMAVPHLAPVIDPTGRQTGLPVIAIPTTAGSGSEVTKYSVITDTRKNEKKLCTGTQIQPIAALVDYEYTMTMPRRLTADTGIDCLSHCVESYVSRKRNDFSQAVALRAMKLIGAGSTPESSANSALRRVYRQGSDDREARENMMMASTLAGMAISQASVALVHGMSRPLGAHFHVTHGAGNAMVFPTITQFSLDSALPLYADCARALGICDPSASDRAAAVKLVDELTSISADLDVPTPEGHGADSDKYHELIPTMTEQCIASGSPNNNPWVPTASEIGHIYQLVYKASLPSAGAAV